MYFVHTLLIFISIRRAARLLETKIHMSLSFTGVGTISNATRSFVGLQDGDHPRPKAVCNCTNTFTMLQVFTNYARDRDHVEVNGE